MNWWEALSLANAASRMAGLPECYELLRCDERLPGADRECEDVIVLASDAHPARCAGWRLPTEAEWEHAARAGTAWAYAGAAEPGAVAWFSETSGGRTHTPCSAPTPRNPWGLCDLSGNLWEWTWDGYRAGYEAGDTRDPVGRVTEGSRAARGGYWSYVPEGVRVAHRHGFMPGFRYYVLGVRLVRTAP